jgi:hypothetical protein
MVRFMKIIAGILVFVSASAAFAAATSAPSHRRITYGDVKKHDTQKYKFGYEWWYFDGKNEKTGEQITITFISHNPFEPRLYRNLLQDSSKFNLLFLHYSDGKGHHYEVEQKLKRKNNVRFLPAATYSDNESEAFKFRLEIGDKNYFVYEKQAGKLPTASIVLDIEDKEREVAAKGTFRLNALFDSHKVAPLLDYKGRLQEYANLMPKALVSGEFTITKNGEAHEVRVANMIGYSDKQWGNGPMNRTVKSWYWGKLDTEDHTIIFWDVNYPKSVAYKHWVPKTPYKLLLVFDKNGMVYESRDAKFEYEAKDMAKTRRDLPYASRFRVRSKEELAGVPLVAFEVQTKSEFMSDNTFYARFNGRARLRSPLLKIEDDSFARFMNFEHGDMVRAQKFMTCAAFFPWHPSCNNKARH